jgi:predicted ATPase
LVCGANGCGKSNLYRLLGLIAAAARGDLVAALAAEGGTPAVFWAGPERTSSAMRRGEQPVQGSSGRREPARSGRIASRTPLLAGDGGDLAAAVQAAPNGTWLSQLQIWYNAARD